MAGPMSHMWYVKSAGRVWGPYPEARVAGFVQEGRVGPATPVSPFPTGPFAPAAGNPEFAPLLKVRADLPSVERAPEPLRAPAASQGLAPPADRRAVQEAAAATGPARPLLVWADLSGEAARTFPAVLAAFGPGVAVRPGLWLIQARMSAPALRNLLSRRLGPADALLIVEADLDRAAWFNVEPARDRELRRLWSGAPQV